jgi:PAS domain S-box-containing protein
MGLPRKELVRYQDMTRAQLVARLRELESGAVSAAYDDMQKVVHDLEVHQVELEMQNRELRESQALLEESRTRFAELYDFAPVVYLTLDEEGRMLEANLTAASLFGLERGRLVGRSLFGYVAGEDRAALRDHLRRCCRGAVRQEAEFKFVVHRGRTLFAHMISAPIAGETATATGCRTALIDVTDRRRVQEKLQFLAHASSLLAGSFDYRTTLAEMARLAVQSLGDICIVDLIEPGGQISRLEVAYADPASAIRQATFRRVPPRADETTALGRAIRTRQPLLFEQCTPTSLASTAEGFDHEILIKVSGARAMMVAPILARDVVMGAITVIAAESGRRYTGISLSTLRDLANHAGMAIDSARMYERAQDAARQRGNVLSFVSHDLRNPLMGILLTTEIMLRSVPGEERRRGWKQLERIRRSAQQMRRMIDDLVDIASLDAGRLTVSASPHDVSELFEDASGMLGPLAAEKGIALRFDAPETGLIVRCDRERVVQVLSNLIGNAVKFTPANGSVAVGVRALSDRAQVTVTDTGPGVPFEMRPHIFDRFWTARDGARRGRGLGLFIAKGLVEAQGGTLWLDSPQGGGAQFSFTLPLASGVEVDSLKEAMETQRGSFGHRPIVGPE